MALTDNYVERRRTDLAVSENALTLLENRAPEDAPFFAFVSFLAPYDHATWTDGLYGDVKAPRTPDLNEADVSDKPEWIRDLPRLDAEGVADVDEQYRDALRSLVTVDRFVARAVDLLAAKGELDNTYVFFYTDNGAHTGLRRMPYGKRTAYQSDIGFPMIVRGPGIGSNTKTRRLVGNQDIAPTLADLAGLRVPAFVDGRSIRPVLEGAPTEWRSAILSEGIDRDGDPSYLPPTWHAVRTERYSYVEYATGERALRSCGGPVPDRKPGRHRRQRPPRGPPRQAEGSQGVCRGFV